VKKISIVIPVYGYQSQLERLLMTLLSQNLDNEVIYEYEIIIVDDGSPEHEFKKLSKLVNNYNSGKINLIRYEKHKGCYHARNVGIRSANGDIIVFIDSDMEVASDWLRNLVKPLLYQGNVAGVIGKVEPLFNSVKFIFEPVYVCPAGENIRKGFASNNVAYKKDILLSIGCFDESFDPRFRGDTDLALRILKSGYEIVYEPHALAFHPIKKNSIKKLLLNNVWGFHDVLLLLKHMDLLRKNNELCHIIFGHMLKPIFKRFSLAGIFSLILAIVIIMMLLVLGLLATLFMVSVLLISYVVIFSLKFYKYLFKSKGNMTIPITLRIKGAIYYLIYILIRLITRIYGLIKYGFLFF